MARPKSDHRRNSILDAAVRVIAGQGLGAPTALIAKEAGISNGSLFTYFATKTDLLNALYVELKGEMGRAATHGLTQHTESREQFRAMWTHWIDWATTYPEKRRVLAILGVSDEITTESRNIGHQTMAPVAKLLDQLRAKGPMREVPLGFVSGLMTAVADTAIDFIIREPATRQKRSDEAFEALWRILT